MTTVKKKTTKIDGEDAIIFDPREKVEVVATEKHPAKTGSKRKVPVNQINNLVRRGMIEDPDKKTQTKKTT